MLSAASLAWVGDGGEVIEQAAALGRRQRDGRVQLLRGGGMRDDVGQARASSGVMGVDTRMIAGVRACLTFTPDRSPAQTDPHRLSSQPRTLPRPWVMAFHISTCRSSTR
jgi:hypothetical protein